MTKLKALLIEDERSPSGFSVEWKRTGDIDAIHINHTEYKSTQDFVEDAFCPYLVIEEYGNYPRLHLITESCEEFAAQEVCYWLDIQYENPIGEDYHHLIDVTELDVY